MAQLKRYAVSVLLLAAFFLIVSLVSWGTDAFIAMFIFVLLGAAKVLYSALFGQMRKSLPGLRLVDYVFFLVIVGLFLAVILVARAHGSIGLYFVLLGALFLWGVFCLFRWQSLRAGSDVPDDDVFQKKK